jgi:anti-repressor protein
MSELVFKTDDGIPITTSLLVAQKFEKEHKHIMRDIKEIMSKRSAQNWSHFYQSTTYVDSMNRIQEMFLMNRDGFSLLVMGFTGEKALDFKIEYIEAFNKMEETIKSFALPKTFSEALQLAADQAKQIELQNTQIKELEPKAEVYEQISNSDNLLSMNDTAKSIGLGRTTLFKKLKEINVLMSNGNPYQKYIDQGYFQVKIKPIKMGGFNTDYPQTYVTGKGLTWLTKLLN